MPTILQPVYISALAQAHVAVQERNRAEALRCLGIALRAANAAKSAAHRRAIFRAMSFARRIGA